MSLFNRPVSYSQLPLITVTIDSFLQGNLNLMLNIHKFQCGYDLLTTLCIVGDSDLASICVDSTPSCAGTALMQKLCIFTQSASTL